MSERTHSPEGTPQGQTVGEFTSSTETQTGSPSTPSKKRFTRKQKMGFVLGGTVALAVAAVGVFQFLKQSDAAADTGNSSVQQANQNASMRRPLARVGKQPIPWEVVAEECMLRYGNDVLENIINRTIIFQACQEKNILVTKEEVDQEIARIAKKFNLTPENWYAMLKVERNLTPLQYQRDVIWPMLALKKIAGHQAQVTETDLMTAFQSAYGERVKAKMIMMDNFRRITEVWSEVNKAPQDFEEFAKKHSIEPNSKALGGIIPPIRQHGGNKELEQAAFRLKPGEISAVIQVGVSRYVILKCEGRTEPLVKAMTPEIRLELQNALMEEKTQETASNVFGQLKDAARVDNYLKGTSNVPKVQQTSHQTPGTYPQPPTAPRTATQAPVTEPVQNY